MSVQMKHFLISFLVFSFAVAGCTPAIRVIRQGPAEINLSAYKKIAVGTISGQGGEEVSTMLEKSLARSGRFEVVDRRSLEGILRGQNLTPPDPIDPGALTKIGGAMGASALVFGKVTKHQYFTTPSTYIITRMINNHAESGMGYKLVGSWFLDVELSIADIPAGKTLVTRTYRKVAQITATGLGGLPDQDWDEGQGFTSLSQDIVDEFMKQTAPWSEDLKVRLYKAGSLPALEKGISYARQGNWASAIEQFTKACSSADSDPAIKPADRAHAHYDLGVALGYSGTSYDRALSELQKAVDIDPEDAFYEEMRRIRRFQADDARLKGLGENPGGGQSLLPFLTPAG